MAATKKPKNQQTNKRKQGVNRKVADGSRKNVKKGN